MMELHCLDEELTSPEDVKALREENQRRFEENQKLRTMLTATIKERDRLQDVAFDLHMKLGEAHSKYLRESRNHQRVKGERDQLAAENDSYVSVLRRIRDGVQTAHQNTDRALWDIHAGITTVENRARAEREEHERKWGGGEE